MTARRELRATLVARRRVPESQVEEDQVAFTATTRLYPGIGMASAMQPHVEARTKALQAAGLEAQLTAVRWGPDFPCLLVTTRHDSLADWEKAQPTLTEIARQFGPLTSPLSRVGAMASLQERLQSTNPSSTTKWQQANVLAPALGKSAALREYLLEDGRRVEAEGRSTALLVQVAGPESGVFVRLFNYDSLGDLEAARARVPIAEGAAARAERRDALLSRPISLSIRQVLVPYVAR